MKALKFLIVALVAVCCTSCGKSKMTPESENINGPLNDYFEVVVRDYAATQDGKVGVEFKRIAEGFPEPWNDGIKFGDDDGEFEFEFTVEFMDADGNVLSTDETHLENDKEVLEVVAALGIDETATIMFDCGKDAKQFKVGSTFEFHGEIERTVCFDGIIGKYPIVMTLHIAPDRKVTGTYTYKHIQESGGMIVKGRKYYDQLTLDVFFPKGKFVGTFDGTYSDSSYDGRYEATSGTYEFELYHANVKPIDFSSVDFTVLSKPEPPFQASQTSTWEVDAALDEMERVVNRIISCYRRGNFMAMMEAVSLMEELQRLAKRIMKDASDVQIARSWELMNKLQPYVR